MSVKKVIEEKPKLSFTQEFLEFVRKYQVVGLAVAFVIGSAATKLVTAVTNDLILPIVNVLLPGGNWQTAMISLGPFKFLVGDFIGQVIDFLIIALIVFVVVKYIMREEATEKR